MQEDNAISSVAADLSSEPLWVFTADFCDGNLTWRQGGSISPVKSKTAFVTLVNRRKKVLSDHLQEQVAGWSILVRQFPANMKRTFTGRFVAPESMNSKAFRGIRDVSPASSQGSPCLLQMG